jgi:hypothetical protein
MAAFLCACAGSPPREGATSGRAYAGKTLAVILPDSSGAIAKDPEAVFSAYPRDRSANATLAAEFGDAFWSGFAPAIDYAIPARVPDSLGAGRAPGVTPELPNVPTREWLAERGISADLVLVIGPLSVANVREQIIAPRFGGSLTMNFLALDLRYTLWDYGAGARIAEGRVKPKVEYRGNPDGRDWQKAYDKAVGAVGDGLPFKGAKWYRR